MKLLGNRTVGINQRIIRKVCNSSALEGNFNFVRSPPFHGQPIEIKTAEEALQFGLWKISAQGLRNANIYNPSARVVKFSRANKYLETAIHYGRDTFLSWAA